MEECNGITITNNVPLGEVNVTAVDQKPNIFRISGHLANVSTRLLLREVDIYLLSPAEWSCSRPQLSTELNAAATHRLDNVTLILGQHTLAHKSRSVHVTLK